MRLQGGSPWGAGYGRLEAMKESATEQTDNAVVLQTMGCRLNHAEAAAIRGVLESAGTAVLPTVHPAAGCGYVLHTCAVTAAAQTEALRHLRSARRAGARPIVVSGCTANVTEQALLFEAGADVAVIRGPEGGDYSVAVSPAAESAATAAALGKHVAEALRFPRCAGTLPAHASTRAPVKIQDGCSFRCSYCIVPDARGNPRSRPLADVFAECEALAAHGFRELVLTGVNVACWTDGDRTFSDVVRAVSAIRSVARVRMSSVEPRTGEEEVVALLAEARTKLCRTLHYPMQSGSDRILARMRRRYTAADYRRALDRVLATVPDIGLGADIITGFPGEDEAAFAETVRLVEDYPFSNLHVFPYSERPGTPAAAFPDPVPVRVRRDRARILLDLGVRKRAAFAQRFIGRTVEVLIERTDGAAAAHGWSSEYLPVRFAQLGPADEGMLLRGRVTAADGETLLVERTE